MPLENIVVRPWEHLEVQFDNTCRLLTPWLDLELELSAAARQQLLRWKTEGEIALHACQPVFVALLRYPICYSLPRRATEKAHALESINPLPEVLLHRLQSCLNPSDDIEAATHEQGEVDALALLTRHRLLRFRRRAARSRTGLEQLSAQAIKYPEAYTEFLFNLATHGLCITQEGLLAVDAARESWSEASAILNAYHEDEKGHDRLVASSCLGLASAKWDEGALASVREVMALFLYAAENSKLAFLLALDVFECIPYTEGDLALWDIQDSLQPNGASAGIRRHRAINHTSRHSDIAFELALRFPWYQANEAGLAWAIADAIDQTLLNTFHSLMEGFMNHGEAA